MFVCLFSIDLHLSLSLFFDFPFSPNFLICQSKDNTYDNCVLLKGICLQTIVIQCHSNPARNVPGCCIERWNDSALYDLRELLILPGSIIPGYFKLNSTLWRLQFHIITSLFQQNWTNSVSSIQPISKSE